MSDSAEKDCHTDLVSKGIKAYWLKDYQTSVTCLSKASAMLYSEHQDEKFDGLGNVQLYYGKALLELSREAADPLGQIIPREVGRAPRPGEVIVGDELGEEEESEVEVDGEDSSSGEEEEVEEGTEASQDADAVEKQAEEQEEQRNGDSKAKAEVAEADDDYLSSATNDSQEDVGNTTGSQTSQDAIPDTSTHRDQVVTSSDDKNGTTELQSLQDSGCEDDPPQASTSTGGNAEENKTAATSDDLNGNSDEDTDAEEVGNEEDELSDLQLAWEVLEVAKEIFQKRGESGREDLADAMITLGEISMENGNFAAAIADIRQGLAIQSQIFQDPKDMRKLAQSYYILGMALCGNEEFSEGLTAYEETAKLLKERLALLKAIENPRESDEREIADITTVLPDVNGKMKDVVAYQEAKKQEEEEDVEQAGDGRELAGVSSNSDKKVNNISHLVKRKRDEANDAEESVAKKATA